MADMFFQPFVHLVWLTHAPCANAICEISVGNVSSSVSAAWCGWFCGIRSRNAISHIEIKFRNERISSSLVDTGPDTGLPVYSAE